MKKRISTDFYTSNNILKISKNLLGKVLCTKINDQFTTGKIVEVEAYLGSNDKASHSYNNKKTKRTAPMFASGGIAYVYLCYGIHHLFNIVTNTNKIPHAVLIIADYQYKSAFVADQEINLVACLTELMSQVKFK